MSLKQPNMASEDYGFPLTTPWPEIEDFRDPKNLPAPAISYLSLRHTHSDDLSSRIDGRSGDEATLQLYNQGTPLITRPMLEDLSNQFKNFDPNQQMQTISVTGVHGKSRKIYIGCEPTKKFDEYVVWKRGKLQVEYFAIQDLLRMHDGNLMFGFVSVCQEIHPFHRTTGESLTSRLTDSVEGVQSLLQSTHKTWLAGETHARVQSIIQDHPQLPHVTKIVAFSLSGVSEIGKQRLETGLRRRSMVQHSFVLALRDLLIKKQGKCESIECYVQDPAYMDADAAALQSLGITVLDDPDAFLKVDQHTLVVSIASNICVKQIITELARPAIIIWDHDEQTDEERMLTDPPSSRLFNMLKEYDFAAKLEERDDFGHLDVFVRRLTSEASAIGMECST